MPIAVVLSRALRGLSAPAVRVEVHLANGLPQFTVVGLPEASVRESRDRVRAALQHSGYEFPSRRITVNLAPADLPKDSGRFDLPIALGIVVASGQAPADRLEDHEYAGELSLTGALRPIRAALALACCTGERPLVLPEANLDEAAHSAHPRLLGAHTLKEVVDYLRGHGELCSPQPRHIPVPACPAAAEGDADLADVEGQLLARRALEISAAGHHHLLMQGPPGTGKSMLARRLPGILPPATREESLQAAAIASLTGRLDAAALNRRPWRQPHHSVSAIGLIGGGNPPRPGEVSLAHHGVLFLDEIAEFQRHALDMLREPLETGQVTITRGTHTEVFPASFRLIATCNPCPCGFLGDPVRACECRPDAIRRHRARLSGPLMDRFDLAVRVDREARRPLENVSGSSKARIGRAVAGESSAAVAERVQAAAARAIARQGCWNGKLGVEGLMDRIRIEDDALNEARTAAHRFDWSMRALHRTLKVARTIADLRDCATIAAADVLEATALRRLLATPVQPTGVPTQTQARAQVQARAQQQAQARP